MVEFAELRSSRSPGIGGRITLESVDDLAHAAPGVHGRGEGAAQRGGAARAGSVDSEWPPLDLDIEQLDAARLGPAAGRLAAPGPPIAEGASAAALDASRADRRRATSLPDYSCAR
jgi:hypothetical protein